MVLDLILVYFFHDWGKNDFIFRVGNSLSVHNDNKKKDILAPDNSSTQRLDTTITAEIEYCINFSRSQKRFCLSLHYNGSRSFFICYWHKKYINLKQMLLK